ncbi:peptidase [Sphaerisporangium corydalis]|uniref:Peptidase n=1 Tax=Sphaerisporangium corydalis TaxID=1441875 RepID=A0ABV9EAP4_9ACTN|nr:peptidase [Sphaerisporangium corydalis]
MLLRLRPRDVILGLRLRNVVLRLRPSSEISGLRPRDVITGLRLRGLVLGLLAAGALAPAAAPPGVTGNGLGISLADAPVSARADSRAWRYIVDHLAPGTVIRRRVEVSNTTGIPLDISLYPAAGMIRDRAFRFAPGRTSNELSRWTTLSRAALKMAPHTRTMVTATIAVPDDAAPGERYAVIWAEAAKDPPPGGGVRKINRVGVRIYLSVGRGNPPASDFTIDSLTARRMADGRQAVFAGVRNTGGRAVDLSGDLRLSNGPGRLSAGPFDVQTGMTLAPGDAGSVSVNLGEQVPDGPWLGRLRLESGLTKRSASATIRFPAATGTADAVKAMAEPGGPPVVVLAVAAVLSALTAAGLLLVRRRRLSNQLEGQGDA